MMMWFGTAARSFSRQTCHQRRWFQTHSIVRRRQTIQLVSLPESSSSASAGILLEQLVSLGDRVASGQVVARVSANKNESSIAVVDICAPRAGTLLEWHCQVDDPVKVGDEIVSVDVPDEEYAEETQQYSPLQQAWLQHWSSSQESLDPSFWDNHVTHNTDMAALQELAALLDQTPPTRLHALRVYERILALQQDFPKTEQAQTHTLIGTLFYRLGDLGSAQSHLQHAVDLHSNETSSLDVMAASHIHLAAVLNKTGDFKGCFDEMKRALELQQEHFGNQHPVVAASLNNLGAILYSLGDWDGAIQYYQRGLELHQSLHGDEHVDTAGSHNNLGIAYKHKGDYGNAMQHIQKALTIRKALLGNEHPDIAASHYSLAQLLSTVNELDASLEQYQAALQIQESIYGRQHPITASTINNIGAVLYQQQDHSKALEMYEKGLAILTLAMERNAGQPQLVADVASSYNNVALAHLQLGHYDKAMDALQTARQLQMDLYHDDGNDHPSLAVTIGAMGNVYKAQGHFDQALAEYETAHTILERSLGLDSPDVASSHNNIGLVHAMQGNYDTALQHYEKACHVFSTSLGDSHPYVGSCYFNMALLKQQQADIPKAMHYYLEARDVWRSSLGPDHPQTLMSLRAIEDLHTSPAPKPPTTSDVAR